tara:strand:+ start:90 stop:362 length:273 start_codon:yes stop_codon:yes gene_type:complete
VKKRRETKKKTLKQRWKNPRIRKKGTRGKERKAGAKHWNTGFWFFSISPHRWVDFCVPRKIDQNLRISWQIVQNNRYSRMFRQISPNAGF